MKKKLTIYFSVFYLICFNLHANTTLPFKNINVHEKPIQYSNIVFEDFDKKQVNLNNYNNKIYILNFWATWCAPCKKEMPSLDKLQQNKDIEVFAINLEKKNKKRTEKFFADLNIKNLSIFYDPDLKLVKLLTIRGVPTSVILNKNREEIARIIGDIDFSNTDFIKWLQNNIKNQ
jgi:thiol-disulfide isomerase/thioredoxin|tara:strand:+ start:158 stop:682 length:525 start_codon:yes stop_codon:yes gene_type:complete